MKIKKNDNVLVTKGKDRGKTGKVKFVLPKKEMIIIDGLNKYKKHIKPTKKNPQGGIVDIDTPMQISNISLICPSCNKATRISYKITKDSKIRICTKCDQSITS